MGRSTRVRSPDDVALPKPPLFPAAWRYASNGGRVTASARNLTAEYTDGEVAMYRPYSGRAHPSPAGKLSSAARRSANAARLARSTLGNGPAGFESGLLWAPGRDPGIKAVANDLTRWFRLRASLGMGK